MYSGFNVLCLIVTVSQTSCSMGHILYLVPIWALATAWLYFLTRLAPALDVEYEVSEMVIIVDLKLQTFIKVSEFFFLILFVIYHIKFLW